MRSLRLATGLAWRNVRHRPLHALLLLLTLTIATGTIGVGMGLYGSADGPWNRVWRQTNGFHVSANFYTDRDATRADAELDVVRARFVGLSRQPGVLAVGGPWDHLYGLVEADGVDEDLTAEIRQPGESPVDQPLVTAGQWLAADSAGVVVEQGLAETLRIGPDDTLLIQGQAFAVRGVAMTVSRGRFPLSRPAQVWVTTETGEAMRGLGMTEEGIEMQLRLDDPADAAAFVADHAEVEGLADEVSSNATLYLETWQQRRTESHSDIDILAGTLFIAGALIGVLTVATAAVVVAGRMAAQTRQIGTLKAVGVTPRQVVLMLLVEHLALAGIATIVGLGVGRVVAPRLADSSLTVLGQPETPPLSAARVAVVAAVAVTVVLLATVRPALRGVRHSTLRSLASGARPPRRPNRISVLASRAGLPLVGVLGLRSAWRRPSRLFTNAVGLTLAVAMIVVAVGLRSSLRLLAVAPTEQGHGLSDRALGTLYDQVRGIVLATAGLMLVLAAVNAFIVASFAARDSARNHATLRAVGATPRQTVLTLIVSQLGACLLAVVVGIPVGLGLWSLMEGGDLPAVSVPGTAMLAVAVAVPVVYALLVALPGWRLSRRPVAEVLTYE